MGVWDAILLGIIQGLTEFLPVSSSGHLVVAQNLLKYEPHQHILFDLLLHLGTLAAVVAVYRASLMQYATESFAVLKGEGSLLERAKSNESIREMFWIGVATIPTGLIGILFRKQFDVMFGSLRMVGMMFAVTGLLLLATQFREGGKLEIKDLGWWRALLIGIAQGLAITPGISRSGTTIACALLIGAQREHAARFSFLLSIPAILGAVLLEARKVNFDHVPLLPISLGVIVSAVVGLLALIFLIRLVKRGRLAWFTLYLWALSGFILWKTM